MYLAWCRFHHNSCSPYASLEIPPAEGTEPPIISHALLGLNETGPDTKERTLRKGCQYPLLDMLREKLQNVSSRHLSKDHPSHFHVQTQATQLPSWQRQTLMSKYHFVWPNGDPKLVLLDCSRTRTRLVFVSINDNDEWRFPCKQLKWYVVKGIHNITEENDEKRTIKPKKKMWVWNICFNFVR